MTARPRDTTPEPVTVTVRWPGGPYDFVLQGAEVDKALTGRIPPGDGWMWLTGYEPGYGGRTFYVRQLGDREYALIPKQAWTRVPADRSRPHHGDHVTDPSHLRA